MEAVAGRPRASDMLAKLLTQDDVAISLVTVGELYEGAFGSADPQAELTTYREYLRAFTVLGLSDPIMERFARLRAEFRRRGTRIPDFDLVVAATALHHDLTVLTNDAHTSVAFPASSYTKRAANNDVLRLFN
jgi:predicted nucleic acid-binding protein